VKKILIFIIIVILLFGFFFFWVVNKEIKSEKILEKRNYDKKIALNLRNSKLFGIKLGDDALSLLFQLKSLGSTYGNLDKVMEPSGLLKGTRFDFLMGTDFSILLNDFIDETTMEQQVKDCEKLYEEIGKIKDEYSCIKPIQKNKNISKYYIKYHPYGDKKISSIVGSLDNTNKDTDLCVKDLKPYANIIAKRIKKENPDENIVKEDNFYPKEYKGNQFPQIKFKYNDNIILTINGYCYVNLKESFIGISSPLLSPTIHVYWKIIKELKDEKELDLKNNFDEDVKNKESLIETKGL